LYSATSCLFVHGTKLKTMQDSPKNRRPVLVVAWPRRVPGSFGPLIDL
jgi:hypothetical protein